MSELFSIQLKNRQQQGGDGVWLDLPTTTEQVQAALRQIGISSDNPQGLFISGYFAEEEKRFAIPYNMVLASNVDELNFLASRLETLSTGERAELNAALQAPQSELFSIGRITDFPENVDYYSSNIVLTSFYSLNRFRPWKQVEGGFSVEFGCYAPHSAKTPSAYHVKPITRYTGGVFILSAYIAFDVSHFLLKAFVAFHIRNPPANEKE